MPLAWAMTQNNLENALRNLGERESGTARLQEAEQAFRKALKDKELMDKVLLWHSEVVSKGLQRALDLINQRRSSEA